MIPYFKKLEHLLKSIFFQFLVEITMTIMTFSSLLNLYKFNVQSNGEITGSMLSVIYMIFLCTLFVMIFGLGVFYFYEIYSRKKEPLTNLGAFDEDIRKTTFKGKYIFFHYRTEHPMHYAYPLFFIFRRIIVSSIIVWWNDDGFYQLMFLSIISGIYLTYHISYCPFESRIRNVCAGMNEGLYLTTCMLLFPYVYPELENKIFYDYIIVFIVIFTIVYCFVISYGSISLF